VATYAVNFNISMNFLSLFCSLSNRVL